MSSRLNLQKVVAPNLPSYPVLWFDARNCVARVTTIHPTWQSVERSRKLVEFLAYLFVIGLCGVAWYQLIRYPVMIRVLASLFTYGLTFPLIRYLLHRTMDDFFARRIFATRTTFWMSREAIAISSRLYNRQLKVWRSWRNRSVRIRYILQPDRQAQSKANEQRYSNKKPRIGHFEESQMLELVITAPNREQHLSPSTKETLLRAIPITEVNYLMAHRLTIVLSAATALTAVKQQATNHQTTGHDIDS